MVKYLGTCVVITVTMVMLFGILGHMSFIHVLVGNRFALKRFWV
jgi:hypothetical protein